MRDPVAYADRGSPAWVRGHCVQLLRYQLGVPAFHPPPTLGDTPLDGTIRSLCPFVDCSVIIDQYNRYRRSQRGGSGQTPKVAAEPPMRTGPVGAAVTDDPTTVTGGVHRDTGTSIGRHTENVGTHVRMHLGTALVRNIGRP